MYAAMATVAQRVSRSHDNPNVGGRGSGKLFECILLQRMGSPLLKEKGILHYTQTTFQSGISCADSSRRPSEATFRRDDWHFSVSMI